MGKATIKAAKGDGLYSVDIIYDTTAFAARKAMLEQRIAAAVAELVSLESRKITAALDENTAAVQLDFAISEKDLKLVEEAAQQWREELAMLQSIEAAIKSTKARKLEATVALQTLLKTPPDPRTVDAWCVDCSDDLTGDVGTIEIAGEEEKGVVIVPGFESAVYDATRDGLLRKREHCGPAEVFLAGAMLPGWQKWNDTYRNGTITAMSSDNCTVALDGQTSTHQGLNINLVAVVTAAFTYMDCHADAFEVGDRVIVRLQQGQDWLAADVIGFESNPKACPGGITHISQAGVRSAWEKKADVLIEKTIRDAKWLAHGNHYWYGSDGTVLSWFGPNGRYSIGPSTFGRVRVGDVICSQLPYPLAFGATFDRVTQVLDDTPQIIGASQYGGLWDIAALEGITATAVYSNGKIIASSRAGSRVCGAWIYQGVLVTASAYSHGTLFEAHNLTTHEVKELLYQEHRIDFSYATNGVPMGDMVIRAAHNTTPWRAKGDGSIAKVERYVTTWEGEENQALQIFLTAQMSGGGWDDIAVTAAGGPPTGSTTTSFSRFGIISNSYNHEPFGSDIDSSRSATAVITDYYMDQEFNATVHITSGGHSRETDLVMRLDGGYYGVGLYEKTGWYTVDISVGGGPTFNFSTHSEETAGAPGGLGGGYIPISSSTTASGESLCLMDMRFGLYIYRTDSGSSGYNGGMTLEDIARWVNYDEEGSGHNSSVRQWYCETPQGGAVLLHSDTLAARAVSTGVSYIGDWMTEETTTVEGNVPVYIEDFNRFGENKILISPLPWAVKDPRGLVATCFEFWKVVDHGDDPDTIEPAAAVNFVDGIEQNLVTSPLPIGVV